MIIDKQINDLMKKKYELIKSYDKKEISKYLYLKHLNEYETEIVELRNKLILDNKKEIKVDEPVVEDVVEKTSIQKRGKKTNPNSYTMLIICALRTEDILSVQRVAEAVNELKPGRDINKIETQTKNIISLVKKQKIARWQQYNWDEEKFLLTDK